MTDVRLMIATPTNRGLHPAHARALVELVADCARRGIAIEYRTASLASVSNARNELASQFLASECTHMLWIDDDIAIVPDVLRRMLAADREFIAVAAVHRPTDPDGFCASVVDRSNPEGLVTAVWVGGALNLLSRAAFERVIAGTPDLPLYASYRSLLPVAAFFTEMIADGKYVDETVSFCIRFRRAGGTIYVLTDADVTHHTTFGTVSGNFAVELRRRRADVQAAARAMVAVDPRAAAIFDQFRTAAHMNSDSRF